MITVTSLKFGFCFVAFFFFLRIYLVRNMPYKSYVSCSVFCVREHEV